MTGLLTDDDVDRIARRLAELLRPAAFRATPDLVDAATLADILGVSRGTVYAHAKALGGERIGTGLRAPLRFDVERARDVMRAMGSGDPGAPEPSPGTRRRRSRRQQHTTGSVLRARGGQR